MKYSQGWVEGTLLGGTREAGTAGPQTAPEPLPHRAPPGGGYLSGSHRGQFDQEEEKAPGVWVAWEGLGLRTSSTQPGTWRWEELLGLLSLQPPVVTCFNPCNSPRWEVRASCPYF